MKSTALLFCLATAVACAQEPARDTAPKSGSTPAKATPAPGPTPEMEAKFKEALTNAVMDGRYCTVADGVLGPDKEDKYTIEGVEKVTGEQWIIKARVEYGTVKFTAPVTVLVKWAGDTPVIVVDNFGLPGTPKYSARVMIFGDTYSGTWNAGDHGGLMHGVLKKAAEKK